MDFTIKLPLEMSGNYGLFGSFDGLLVLQETYPIVPVFDEDGWDIDLPARHGDLTHLDISYYIVRVKVPDDLKVIGSGIVLDHRTQDGWQTLTFAAGPMRDFYLAAGDFQVQSTSFGETRIHSYILPGAEEFNETALHISKTAIAILNERLNKYPYTEFDMISTPMLALGMEYPGVIALNKNMYDPEAQISDLPGTYFLESTIAHEVAHQWYYNQVGTDQLDEPWLDEAIVQYLTGIYFLDAYGEDVFQEYRQSWIDRWQRVEQQPTPIGLPAADYDPRAYGAIVYGRGPLFVEALAEAMGEEAFWKFLRSFTESYKWSIAQPDPFMSMAEDTCACDLSEIWESWGVDP
jgi:aminopeptidase N